MLLACHTHSQAPVVSIYFSPLLAGRSLSSITQLRHWLCNWMPKLTERRFAGINCNNSHSLHTAHRFLRYRAQLSNIKPKEFHRIHKCTQIRLMIANCHENLAVPFEMCCWVSWGVSLRQLLALAGLAAHQHEHNSLSVDHERVLFCNKILLHFCGLLTFDKSL